MREDLILRLPREREEAEFLRAHRATTPEIPYFLHYYEEGMPFTIEKCGGRLEDVFVPAAPGKPKRRYWIETDR